MNQNGLQWDDLFQGPAQIDFQRLYSCWPHLQFGRVRPIGMNAFGDCYFEQENGSVHVLDTLEGGIRLVTASVGEFNLCMNTPQWREQNLLASFIANLHAKGISRQPSQVFGFAPHPAFTGKLNPEHVQVLSPYVWHSICGQVFASQNAQG